MKKKAIKVATASAIAASAFVASAPAQADAASNVAVEVSKAVTQMKKAYHTYSDVTATGEFQDLAVVYKEYNAAKAAYKNAKALVAKAGGTMKEAYNAQLDVTYNDYIAKRVVTYIDAYNYAVKLDEKREALEAAVAAKEWDAAEELYHEISYELKTRTVILDRVYGKSTRELLRGEFKADAEAARDSIAVEVTVKMALEVAADELAEKDLTAAKAALDKAAEWTGKLDKDTDFGKVLLAKNAELAAQYEALLTPAVESVSAINAKQVVVTFNKAVDKSTVLDANNVVQNMTFTMVNGTTANPGALTGKLSEDGKTLTITAASIFDGEYAFKLTDSVKSKAGEKLVEYTSIVKVDDTVAPKLVSASASAKTSTNSIALVFDEPVTANGAIVYVNGVAAIVSNDATNPNRLNVTASQQLAAGSTATVRLTNVKDYNNNFTTPNPFETTVSVVADTVAPTITAVNVIGENKVELTYDKNMSVSSFTGKARLVHANGTVTALTASAGTAPNKVVLTGALTYTSSYNAILFVDADVKDTAGNTAPAYTANVTFNKDVTAPALASTEFKSGKIVATFTEDIAAGTNTTVTAINQATGVATPITLNFTTGGNAVIEDNKLTITQALTDGTYDLRLPAGTVVDTAGTPNANAIATQTFVVKNSVAADTTRPTVTNITNVPVTTGTAPGVEQTATFTVADADSGVNLATVRDINNYTWDGKALPTGSYVTTAITGTADRATSVAVTVHVPSAGFSASKSAAFTVNGLKDNAGNFIAAVGTGTVGFADGVKPEFNSATIAATGTSLVLGFSEAVTNVGNTDFVITLNGTALKATNFTTLTASNTEVNKYVTTVNAAWENDVTIDGATKDVLYIDTDATTAGYNAGDLVLQVSDAATVDADVATVAVDLSSSLVTGLKVKLVEVASSEVKDVQGNTAVFNKEITVK
jgi:trimeric autotransporter adhesin